MLGTTPDLLRLLVVPVFAWAAYRDIETRRLPNRLWYPLVALGVCLLLWDLAGRWPLAGFEDRLFLIRVGFSLFFVVPLSYGFWWIGGFGGADAKALMTLAVVFPTFPTYTVGSLDLPMVEPLLGVFSMTILTNTVVVALVYPLLLLVRNLAVGDVAPVMFLGRRTAVDDLRTEHGRLFETREGFTRSGLDLDALRMYLRWRGSTLADVRTNPDEHRDPASVGQTFEPTDGAVGDDPVADGGSVSDNDVVEPADVAGDDAWAAERFLDEIEGTAYGTSAESLREGLELVAARDTVWISPGLPFVVPMFGGLLVALTYGDLLFGVLGLVGVAELVTLLGV
ncbi:preflagellin peptidase FlaK [Halogranum gelatinilyticum]|uniref:Preflagellin peptidase FlaK n=1 Tax=Halogranum gelatinilyticum TaxID=660521 RepID=A0A1G9NQ43_9EURY|nr:A24 family peptidase [Halogranum gelatinilyticum]SDL88423.1 preflagellin peptidase FlaK [Halogranum gelatinilyticum]